MDYIKRVYKKRVQSEIDSFIDPHDEEKRDTIKAQDILLLNRIFI